MSELLMIGISCDTSSPTGTLISSYALTGLGYTDNTILNTLISVLFQFVHTKKKVESLKQLLNKNWITSLLLAFWLLFVYYYSPILFILSILVPMSWQSYSVDLVYYVFTCLLKFRLNAFYKSCNMKLGGTTIWLLAGYICSANSIYVSGFVSWFIFINSSLSYTFCDKRILFSLVFNAFIINSFLKFIWYS